MTNEEKKLELTEDELLWLKRLRAYIRKGDEGPYVISWHIAHDFGYKTPELNRIFNKIVKKGYLSKKATRACTIYTIVKLPDIIKGHFPDLNTSY